MIAVACSDAETLKSVLRLANEQEVQAELLSGKDCNGNSCLRWGAEPGSINSIKILIDEYSMDWKRDINCMGATFIHDLCPTGRHDILEYLYQTCSYDFVEVGKTLDHEGNHSYITPAADLKASKLSTYFQKK